MKLWLFVFHPAPVIQSARVAASTKEEGAAHLRALLAHMGGNDQAVALHGVRAGAGCIASYLGKVEVDGARILSVILANGREVINEDAQ